MGCSLVVVSLLGFGIGRESLEYKDLYLKIVFWYIDILVINNFYYLLGGSVLFMGIEVVINRCLVVFLYFFNCMCFLGKMIITVFCFDEKLIFLRIFLGILSKEIRLELF